MASEVLMTISRDEEERARLLRDEMIVLDYQSGHVHAERKGREEGREEGRQRRDQWFLEMIQQGLSLEEIQQRLQNSNQG